MQVFAMANEYGVGGYMLVPLLLLFSDQPINLWAPAAGFIEQANAKDNRVFSKKIFLESIEAGLIQVSARENFYDRTIYQRPDNFPEGQWDTGFDAELALISKHDSGKKIQYFEKSSGFTWADKQKEKDTTIYQEAKQLFFRAHWNVNSLPVGMISKTTIAYNEGKTSAEGHELATKMILRDAYNHANSIRDIDPDMHLIYDDARHFYKLVKEIDKSLGNRDNKSQKKPLLTKSTMDIQELCECIDEFASIKTDIGIFKYLVSKRAKEIRENLCYFAYKSSSTYIEQLHQVRNRLKLPNISDGYNSNILNTEAMLDEKVNQGYIAYLASQKININGGAYVNANEYNVENNPALHGGSRKLC